MSSRRELLFGRFKKAPPKEVTKPLLGIRDIRPKTEEHAIALPAERALSAEVAKSPESPPPWARK